MSLPDGPLIAWLGDDFTGAAAVMEVLEFAGLPAVLFLDPPTPGRLARFPGLRGIGLASAARTWSPDEMGRRLPGAFAALRRTGAPILHYKVCSTLDSATHVGSIGHAADLAMGRDDAAPLLVAAPQIGRWQAFGTLFAMADGAPVRLDRHPTMSVHPVTPMDEADVRRHLARQTDRGVGLVDLLALKRGEGARAFAAERDAGRSIVALDVVDDETLEAAGRTIWQVAPEHGGFVIGSQGVEYALVATWRVQGLLPEAPLRPSARAVDRIAVVSGSCAPVTAGQIARAEADGFAAVTLDAATAVDARAFAAECDRAGNDALQALGEGQSPIVATARGPDDPAVARVRTATASAGLSASEVSARIGEGLGSILARIVREARPERLAIAGGDTSSVAAGALGHWALGAVAPCAPGVPILRGYGDDPATDGIEIALKGGQMGPPTIFADLRAGGPGRT